MTRLRSLLHDFSETSVSNNAKISFAIIYIIVVSVLLFVSISIAIRFSSRFFRSINNLISASTSIGEGNFDAKVPEVKTDKDLENPRPEEEAADIHQKMYEIAAARNNPFHVGGSENVQSEIDYIKKHSPWPGGSENFQGGSENVG